MDFDVLIIGSGFGGAITGCRLAEKGYKVLILERGRRWDKTNFPSVTDRDWLWDHANPEKLQGWLDLRVFPHMAVATGAAVGGGSLIYANISAVPPPDVFNYGWPKEITHPELKDYFEAVGKSMNVQEVPDSQQTDRAKLVKIGAEKIGQLDRFKKLTLAVSFDPDWNYGLPDARDPKNSKTFVNAHGATQGTCVHLGDCDLGCRVLAKNTLDLNYLYSAENKYHADVRPLHLVNNIEAPHEKIHGETFNIGLQNYSIAEIANMVKRTVEEEMPEKGDIKIVTTPTNDMRSYHVNSDKVKRVLGFAPKRSIEDAVCDLTRAFRNYLLLDSFDDDCYYNVRTMKKLGVQ